MERISNKDFLRKNCWLNNYLYIQFCIYLCKQSTTHHTSYTTCKIVNKKRSKNPTYPDPEYSPQQYPHCHYSPETAWAPPVPYHPPSATVVPLYNPFPHPPDSCPHHFLAGYFSLWNSERNSPMIVSSVSNWCCSVVVLWLVFSAFAVVVVVVMGCLELVIWWGVWSSGEQLICLHRTCG